MCSIHSQADGRISCRQWAVICTCFFVMRELLNLSLYYARTTRTQNYAELAKYMSLDVQGGPRKASSYSYIS